MEIFKWGYKKYTDRKDNGVPISSKTEWLNTEKRTASINNFRCLFSEPANYRFIDIVILYFCQKRNEQNECSGHSGVDKTDWT